MNRRLQHSLLLRAILLLSLSLIGFACSKNKDAGKATSTTNTSPPTVVVSQVEQRTVPIYSEFVGQTEASQTVEVRARAQGMLEKIFFTEGAVVRKGQILFQIQKSEYQARLLAAK